MGPLRSSTTAFALAATLFACMVSTGHAQVRLLVSDAFNRNLYEVNPSTAASTLIGSFGLPAGTNMAGLAWDETTGTMFGTTTGVGTNALYRINIATGAATAIGSLGSEIFMHGLASGPDGLYGAAFSNLYRINTSTGAATLIGSFNGPTQMHGLDFDATGRLVGSLGVDIGGLHTINTTTGAATFLAPTTRLTSIAFHPVTGELFGVANVSITGAPSALYNINPVTGAATLVGTLPGQALALEFVPAPGGAATLLLLAGVMSKRRRERPIENKANHRPR